MFKFKKKYALALRYLIIKFNIQKKKNKRIG